eukprot:m.735765 g.735765  ORF g.735765 m.735765 type:complete len:362 (-) comp23093_c0_seq5:267-1352(-)
MNKVFIWNVFIHLLSQVVSINSGLKLCAHGTCINACVRVCARVCVALCVAVTPGADAQGTASVRSPTEPAVANHEPTSSDETLGSRTAIRDVLEKPSTTQVDNFPASPTNCKHALVPGGRVSSSRSDGGPTYLRPLTTEATHRVRQGQRHAERQAQNRQRQQKILAAEARAREARREHDTQKQAAAREYHMRHRNVIQSHQKAIAQEVDDLKRAHEHVVAERLSTREAAVARVQAEVEAKRRDRQQWVDAHAQEAHQAKTEADMLRRAQARRQRKQQQEIKHAVHAYLQQLRDATARTRTRQRRAVWSQATARRQHHTNQVPGRTTYPDLSHRPGHTMPIQEAPQKTQGTIRPASVMGECT